jgi:hypothetical protein
MVTRPAPGTMRGKHEGPSPYRLSPRVGWLREPAMTEAKGLAFEVDVI